jgi:hypothetical protein
MYFDFSRCFLLFISLYTLIQFFDKGRSELGQTTLSGTIASISWCPPTLDSTSNSVEDFSLISLLW